MTVLSQKFQSIVIELFYLKSDPVRGKNIVLSIFVLSWDLLLNFIGQCGMAKNEKKN